MTIYRILIVEDDLDMQEMMVSFLQKSGFMVSAVKNAVELSDQLKSQRIDLVLLDVMLGDDNGIKLCKNIRENNIKIPSQETFPKVPKLQNTNCCNCSALLK